MASIHELLFSLHFCYTCMKMTNFAKIRKKTKGSSQN